MSNYTMADLGGGFASVLLFFPVLIVPGYSLAWMFECFGFRNLTLPWRFLVSLPLSVAVCPILTYWLGAFFGWPAIWVFYALLFLVWLALLGGAWKHERPGAWLRAFSGIHRAAWLCAAIWAAIALLSLADLQIGNRLYYSVVAYDYSIRSAVTDAITRTGARPENPLYFLGGPAPLRYHYFWFLLCSMVDRLGGEAVQARQAVIGSAVWCGWALMAIVPLYFRFLCGWTGTALRRRSILAIAFFGITGLDILPTLLLWAKGIVHPDMEWWNMEVTSWCGSAMWVPHHIAALVAGLTGFLLWHSSANDPSRRRLLNVALAGAAFASLLGTSIDVAFVFAVFLTIWIFVELFLGRRREALLLVLAGLITVILIEPYLRGLTGPGAGGSFAKFTIRAFLPVDEWAQARHLSRAAMALLRLGALPLNYVLELGFFLAAGIAYPISLRQRRTLGTGDLPLLFMAAVSVFICTFLRSGVISDNDLGMRGFLPAQFVLLLWAADLFVRRGETAERASRGFHSWWLRSAIWAPLLFLGLAGSIYEIGILRFFGIMADSAICQPHFFSPDRQLGLRTFALRRTYEQLKHTVPQRAIIQNNPKWTFYDFAYGLYANRQTAAYDGQCGAQFGGDPAHCLEWLPSIEAIFAGPPSVSLADVNALCRRTAIEAVILKDVDPAWKDRNSWVWKSQPAISNDFARVYLFEPGAHSTGELSRTGVSTISRRGTVP